MSRRLSRACWLLLAGLSVAPALAQASGYTVRAGGVIVDRPPRPEVMADLGTARQLAQARDYQAALPMYLMLAASDPNDAEMAIEVARVLGFADRNAASAAPYRRRFARSPPPPPGHMTHRLPVAARALCSSPWRVQVSKLVRRARQAWRPV